MGAYILSSLFDPFVLITDARGKSFADGRIPSFSTKSQPLVKKGASTRKIECMKMFSLSSIINVFHHSSVGSKRGGVTGGRFRRRPFSIVLLPLFSDGNQRRYLKKKGIHYLKL